MITVDAGCTAHDVSWSLMLNDMCALTNLAWILEVYAQKEHATYGKGDRRFMLILNAVFAAKAQLVLGWTMRRPNVLDYVPFLMTQVRTPQ